MSQSKAQDKRLLERMARIGSVSRTEFEALPDLAERTQRPTSEDLERLATRLMEEQAARAERIERFVKERHAPPPPRPPVQPMNEADL